jgi:hypothetical protein
MYTRAQRDVLRTCPLWRCTAVYYYRGLGAISAKTSGLLPVHQSSGAHSSVLTARKHTWDSSLDVKASGADASSFLRTAGFMLQVQAETMRDTQWAIIQLMQACKNWSYAPAKRCMHSLQAIRAHTWKYNTPPKLGFT